MGVLSQYEKFVKPSFEEYVSPVPISFSSSSSHLLCLLLCRRRGRRRCSRPRISLLAVCCGHFSLTYLPICAMIGVGVQSKKYADMIIPRGAANKVAIDLLVQVPSCYFSSFFVLCFSSPPLFRLRFLLGGSPLRAVTWAWGSIFKPSWTRGIPSRATPPPRAPRGRRGCECGGENECLYPRARCVIIININKTTRARSFLLKT